LINVIDLECAFSNSVYLLGWYMLMGRTLICSAEITALYQSIISTLTCAYYLTIEEKIVFLTVLVFILLPEIPWVIL